MYYTNDDCFILNSFIPLAIELKPLAHIHLNKNIFLGFVSEKILPTSKNII
jgi:hypothetical protein